MSNIYEVFNVTNDYELSKVFDKLDLSYNEMTNIDYIVESMNKENARNKILEIMAGSADGNYEVCLEQFAKTIKKRVLKEESGLNLNQIMELNKLVELVASKLSANQQQCLEGIYNIISQKAGVNAAKTFIGMVQQSSVNQSSLKFNTDLVVDGKNLAQVIYALKNEIEIFCNSIKKEESEKDEIDESVLMERLFPEIDNYDYNNLLRLTSDNGRANAYTKWLGKLFLKGDINPFENNFHNWKDIIASHKRLRNARKVKDIMQYSSWKEMEDDVDNKLENHMFNSDFNQKAKEGFNVIATEGSFILGEVNNREAAIKYGKGTKWCTSSVNDDQYFKKYKNEDENKDLFYLIDKNDSSNNLGIEVEVSEETLYIVVYNNEDKTELNICVEENENGENIITGEGWYDDDTKEDEIEYLKNSKNVYFTIREISKYFNHPINFSYLTNQRFNELDKMFNHHMNQKNISTEEKLTLYIVELCFSRYISLKDLSKYFPLIKEKFNLNNLEKSDDDIISYIISSIKSGKYFPIQFLTKPSDKAKEKLFNEYLTSNSSKPITESYSKYQKIVQELDKAVDDVSDINVLKSIAERVNTLLGKVKNMNEANEIASLKTTIETKMNSLMDVKPSLEECCLATQVAQDVCGEDTFNGLLDSVKPTVINITVNKEDNGILPCLDNCCDVPCCDVPCNDCGDTDIAPIVQPMNFEPTAIDAPILRKPNSAEVTSAITALSSHTNDIKSDSRENNLENLQTINTLLGQISNYFNTLLGESFNIGDKIANKKGINDEVMEITDKYEKDGREVYDVKVDLGNGIKAVSKGLDVKDLEDKNEKIESLWDGEEDEQLDEETVYDHTWFEVEGQKYPKRTKNGVEGLPIKEMSNFEEFDSLIVENYRQYAGILDLNDNSLFYLPQGEIHHNYIKESDVFNGKVRFGVAEYRGKVVGYISSDSREHMMKALKILKRELSSAPISYWMVEYFEDGQRVRMNIDDNGRTVYENKNDWFPAWGNVKKLVETCSAGACCAASVATVPSKPKKAKSKPRKQESFDVSLFKESVRNDCPATLTINDKMVSYKLVEGKGYLYIDNGIVKTLDKDVMLETIDDVYNNCLDIDVLEGYNAYELNILLEDEMNSDMNDVDSVTTITPDEKKKAQTELDNNLAQKPNAKINVVSSENNGEIHQNQEFIGIDDHDESNKKYIVKDPATGKITVADYNQIKIAEN